MAAKGQAEKQEVIQKILKTFEGSFIYNDSKEVRVPVGDVQIKLTFACAKENVTPDGEEVVTESNDGFPAPVEKKLTEPTQEELDRVQMLVNKLNL